MNHMSNFMFGWMKSTMKTIVQEKKKILTAKKSSDPKSIVCRVTYLL